MVREVFDGDRAVVADPSVCDFDAVGMDGTEVSRDSYRGRVMRARDLTGEVQVLFNAGNGDPLVLVGPDSCSVRNALAKRDAARLLERLRRRSCEILRLEEIAHRAGVGH